MVPNIFSLSLTACEVGSTKVTTMVTDLPLGPQLTVHGPVYIPFRTLHVLTRITHPPPYHLPYMVKLPRVRA